MRSTVSTCFHKKALFLFVNMLFFWRQHQSWQLYAWLKHFRLGWDLNPWPSLYQCSALPIKLSSHLGAGHFARSKYTWKGYTYTHAVYNLWPKKTDFSSHALNRPFARSGHMVQNEYTGTQITQWDFQTKESRAGLVRVPLFWKSHCVICVPV